MRLVGLISGGKDSIFNMLQCIAAGHEVVALANIEPSNKEELDSYMYQSVGHQVVSLIAGALALPIFRNQTEGKAICKSKTYTGTANDEVEDLYQLLQKVKKQSNIEGVAVGAIASDYQRTRVESVCSRLKLKCFAYLWQRDQEELLQEMIDADLDAILIKIACIGLHPDTHLGMHIKDIKPHMVELNKKFGVHICGEGGEYESLTLDCPLFHRKLSLVKYENVILSNDAFAPVAFLNIKNAILKEKHWENDDPVKSLETRLNYIKSVVRDPYSYVKDCTDDVTAAIFPQNLNKFPLNDLPFPFESRVHIQPESSENFREYWKTASSMTQTSTRSNLGLKVSVSPSAYLIDSTNCNLNYSTGWCSIGNVTGSNITDAFTCLQKHLERIKYEFCDAVFINLYVRDMSDFANINKVYSQYMPEVLPPARSCVGTALPPEVGALITMVAHKQVSKSQKALITSSASERDALHVQSISHWAPANIGPYSQCVTVGGLYYLAGQIPLIPGTMEIFHKPVYHQCRLALRHVLRILQAMNNTFTFGNVFQAICYVTSEELAKDMSSLWSYITKSDGAIVTAVVVVSLPKQAQLEWEVIGCSFVNPEVHEETLVVDDYNLHVKRRVYSGPYACSLVCKISYVTKSGKTPGKSLKLVTQDGISKVIKKCIELLRADLKNTGTPLCMMKLFHKTSLSSLSRVVGDSIKYSVDYKVVCTAIPVIGCENPEVFLTVTGVCH